MSFSYLSYTASVDIFKVKEVYFVSSLVLELFSLAANIFLVCQLN